MKIQNSTNFITQNAGNASSISKSTTPIASKSLILKHDTVSFGKRFPMNAEQTAELAKALTESTSGVRKIGKEYEEIIEPLTQGVMAYCAKNGIKEIVVAHDTRQLTTDAGRKITGMLLENGFNVHIDTKGLVKNTQIGNTKPVSTPLLATAAKEIARKEGKETFAFLLSPSHNPWNYGGFNLVTSEATIAPASVTNEIGNFMKDMVAGKKVNTKVAKGEGKIKIMNPLKMYNEFINKNVGIDWKSIQKAQVPIIYEDMQGAGKTCLPQFFEMNGVKIEKHLSSEAPGPNPVDKNLTNLKAEVEKHPSPLAMGLANDGDADRFGVVYKGADGKAKFMNPNDVILLVGHHMFANRGMAKKPNTVVIINHATSPEIAALARKHGAECIQTPVGFKYIAEDIVELSHKGKNVVVAGEESAGLTVNGGIPEKDGLVVHALLAELVAKENKPLDTILTEVKEGLGVRYSAKLENYAFDSKEKMNTAVDSFNKYLTGEATEFAGFKVDTAKTQAHNEAILKYKPSGDGTKVFLEGGSEVMLRKSGTEPITRGPINAAGKTPEEAAENYKKLRTALTETINNFGGEVH